MNRQVMDAVILAAVLALAATQLYAQGMARVLRPEPTAVALKK